LIKLQQSLRVPRGVPLGDSEVDGCEFAVAAVQALGQVVHVCLVRVRALIYTGVVTGGYVLQLLPDELQLVRLDLCLRFLVLLGQVPVQLQFLLKDRRNVVLACLMRRTHFLVKLVQFLRVVIDRFRIGVRVHKAALTSVPDAVFVEGPVLLVQADFESALGVASLVNLAPLFVPVQSFSKGSADLAENQFCLTFSLQI